MKMNTVALLCNDDLKWLLPAVVCLQLLPPADDGLLHKLKSLAVSFARVVNNCFCVVANKLQYLFFFSSCTLPALSAPNSHFQVTAPSLVSCSPVSLRA